MRYIFALFAFVLIINSAYAASPQIQAMQNEIIVLNETTENLSYSDAELNDRISLLNISLTEMVDNLKTYIVGLLDGLAQRIDNIQSDIENVNETAEAASASAAEANQRIDSLTPSLCIGEWSPVCGSNGKTYINYCEATWRANVLVSANVSCAECTSLNEICNGLDDNCDGSADNGIGTVSCGVGACANTVQGCVNGAPQTCVPNAPSLEFCDEIDNDCDGQVDDDAGSSCNDENPCTQDFCAGANGCMHTPVDNCYVP